MRPSLCLKKLQHQAQLLHRRNQDPQAAGSHQAPVSLNARDESPRDIIKEWVEIEQEERLVRAELARALPGDPILSPIENLPTEELIDLPFKVYTTKYGSVYHDSLHSRYLTATGTGVTRSSIWCSDCRRKAKKKRQIPKKGDAVFIDGWGASVRSDPTCERADRAKHFCVLHALSIGHN